MSTSIGCSAFGKPTTERDKMNTKPEIEVAPETTIKAKRGKKKTVFVEEPKHVQTDVAAEVFHTPTVNPRELQELLDRDAPLERVVVRCNRETKQWMLYRNNEPYKALSALILINVSFSSEWDKDGIDGCTNKASGAYMGFAAGDLLPTATPLTVPTHGVVGLKFNPSNGQFWNENTGDELKGAGYLILKEGCSSEYVTADAIGAK